MRRLARGFGKSRSGFRRRKDGDIFVQNAAWERGQIRAQIAHLISIVHTYPEVTTTLARGFHLWTPFPCLHVRILQRGSAVTHMNLSWMRFAARGRLSAALCDANSARSRDRRLSDDFRRALSAGRNVRRHAAQKGCPLRDSLFCVIEIT